MSEVMKCPKCAGEMEIGYLDGAYTWQEGRSYLKSRAGAKSFRLRLQEMRLCGTSC